VFLNIQYIRKLQYSQILTTRTSISHTLKPSHIPPAPLEKVSETLHDLPLPSPLAFVLIHARTLNRSFALYAGSAAVITDVDLGNPL
jgi:hypothetical protein